jgi:DNA-binding HxlR family transcriptional regulator
VYPKTLTRTLEHLQREGLVKHHHDVGAAARNPSGRRRPGDYRLTTAGMALVDLIAELGRWTREHRTEADEDEDGR